eukprot:g31227.t1
MGQGIATSFPIFGPSKEGQFQRAVSLAKLLQDAEAAALEAVKVAEPLSASKAEPDRWGDETWLLAKTRQILGPTRRKGILEPVTRTALLSNPTPITSANASPPKKKDALCWELATKYHHRSCAYCQQHGHRFRRVLLSPEDMAKLAGGRHLAWAKVALLRNLLRGRGYDGSASGDFEEDFDYLVWIDADALVLDHSVRLEDFLELPVPAMDFIIGEDMADTDLLNTGLMFFRRSQWCRELLRRWWEESDPKWHQEVCWDQTGLCRLLRQDGFGREEPWYSWAGGARYKNWKGHIFTVDCGSFNFKYLNNCGFVFHAVGERELLLSGTRNLLLKRDRLYMAVRDGFVLHGGDASTCPSEALGLLPAAEVPEAKASSREQLYRHVEALCVSGRGQQVFQELLEEAMDPELLKSLVELLRSLDFYKDFEVAFLEQSAQFYREASDCWQREKSLAEYLLLADEHLKAFWDPGWSRQVSNGQGGRRAMQSSEDAKQVVPELVRWLGSTQEVLSLAFGNDAGFLNAAPNHAAKLLTRYLDVLLRGDEVTPAEPLAFAPPARAFFKKDLAKRLLQRSASEGELAATTWLREECGGAYTAGIEGMFQDMEISRVLAQVFHSEAKTLLEERADWKTCTIHSWNLELQVDFQVSVLTTGKWPSSSTGRTSFEAFYGQQHRGRSLRWCPAWGRCWLRANAAAKKELVVSHFQALVLLCFNGSDVLSYEKLQELTQIPPAELQLTLQSLSLHRTEQLQEEDAVEQRVVGSRQHELDAVVIRELLAEVLSSVRFPVEAAELQRRIESLIEREYLERQPPNDQGIISYIYLA